MLRKKDIIEPGIFLPEAIYKPVSLNHRVVLMKLTPWMNRFTDEMEKDTVLSNVDLHYIHDVLRIDTDDPVFFNCS